MGQTQLDPDTVAEPTHHYLVRSTYTPSPLPDFDVYSAVIELSSDTVEHEVEA